MLECQALVPWVFSKREVSTSNFCTGHRWLSPSHWWPHWWLTTTTGNESLEFEFIQVTQWLTLMHQWLHRCLNYQIQILQRLLSSIDFDFGVILWLELFLKTPDIRKPLVDILICKNKKIKPIVCGSSYQFLFSFSSFFSFSRV